MAEETKDTNVTVFLLQQVSVFSKWWARSEENFSIGLIGRFVFSFAAAGEPGPPSMAEFESTVAIPILKEIFHLMLKTLGPHAPLPSDAPLLHWSTMKATQEDVHLYRVLCHELTRTMPMDETLANCLNKNGYWLSSVGFLNAVLHQMWPCVVDGNEKCQLQPQIGHDAVKVAMEFFTTRFLFGASVLCADMRKRTWDKIKRIRVLPADSRWNVPAALVIKLATCGWIITAEMAARAAPMFRPLLEKGTKASEQAGALYVQALQYLMERGFGVSKHCDTSAWPIFVKRHYYDLPQSCKDQLAEIRVHPLSFGLHVPWTPRHEASGPSMHTREDTSQEGKPEAEQRPNRMEHATGDTAAKEGGDKTMRHCPPTDAQKEAGANTEQNSIEQLRGLDGTENARRSESQQKEPGMKSEQGNQAQARREENSEPHGPGAPDAHQCRQTDEISDAKEDTPPGSRAGRSTERRDKEPESVAEERGNDQGGEEDTAYETIFCGKPDRYICTYSELRDCVCGILASKKDQGVYTFHDKGCRGQYRKLMATCKDAACEGCTVTLWAFYTKDRESPEIRLRMRGRHGQLTEPAGGRLWTVTEEYIIKRDVEEMTSANVRAALQKAKLTIRCTSGQLHDFVAREKKKHGSKVGNQTGLTIGELKASISPFQVEDMKLWEQLPVHQLLVLPDAVVDADRVCIVFTCPGMIARGSGAANKAVKLAVDGKQKVVSNEYTIVTVSFLVPNEAEMQTRDPKKRSVRVKAHTCSQEPFVQALVSSEREENITQIFESACVLAEAQCHVDLRHQVLQVHKDYAKGIEASRKKVFSQARRCDDYPHMRRATYTTLEKLFGVGQKKSRAQPQV